MRTVYDGLDAIFLYFPAFVDQSHQILKMFEQKNISSLIKISRFHDPHIRQVSVILNIAEKLQELTHIGP